METGILNIANNRKFTLTFDGQTIAVKSNSLKAYCIKDKTQIGARNVFLHMRNGKLIFTQIEKDIHFEPHSVYASMLPDFTLRSLKEDFVPDNFYLELFKTSPYLKIEKDKPFDFHIHHYQGSQAIISFNKQVGSQALYNSIQKRQNNQIKNQGLNLSPIPIELKNDYRLIIGLGNESVYENGMTLHHIYGIPYIPASAVKGITRSWIITEAFGSDEKAESRANEDNLFTYIFGKGGDGDDDGNKGNAYFFDAFPTTVPKIEPDITNNHYQSYYDGNTPPADWISPNPVFFLTVKEGKFCFQVGVKKNVTCKGLKTDGILKEDENLRMYKLPEDRDIFSNDTNILDIITGWLKDALEHHGIGAKTAVGYGRMKGVKYIK
jgi:CRISPR-associated protein Cmr6